MMAGTEKIIYVYDDFSEDNPILIGKMYVGVIKGGETYSFENYMIVIIFLEYMMKQEWEEYDLNCIQMMCFFQMIRKQRHLHGHHCEI